ncbi:MAG: hypothetical protein U0894_08750 [Pirellulales bacterium]
MTISKRSKPPVLWYTEGKGDEAWASTTSSAPPADADEGDLRPMRRLRVTLPSSPLTYRGAILKVLWCIRIRLFLRNGKDLCCELPFTLGAVPAVTLTENT